MDNNRKPTDHQEAGEQEHDDILTFFQSHPLQVRYVKGAKMITILQHDLPVLDEDTLRALPSSSQESQVRNDSECRRRERAW